jgi:hypothetical protein
MQNLINKYREHPAGIRNDPSMINVCIRCSSRDVRSKNDQQTYFKICNQCGNSWYHNHCWSCSSHQQVDSRDSENYICTSCGWVKCTCGACRQSCGHTGQYEKNHAVEPTEVEREKIEAEKAALRIIEDKKRQKMAEYEKIKKDAQDEYHNHAFKDGFFSGLKKVIIPDQFDKLKENNRDNIVKACDINLVYLRNQPFGTFDTKGLNFVQDTPYSYINKGLSGSVALGVDLSFRSVESMTKDKPKGEVVITEEEAEELLK